MTENENYKTVSATPKVRKFARELGVDINKVTGSERQGRVTESDIKLFVSNRSSQKKEFKIKNEEKIKLEYSHCLLYTSPSPRDS